MRRNIDREHRIFKTDSVRRLPRRSDTFYTDRWWSVNKYKVTQK